MASLLHSESRRLYSWWWDSHISPKNSRWLQENLTDMDAKVKLMIKLIEEDADSFARRAEMYYKKRPELMKLVEESYRAYRALAERYDHAMGALRQAHRTMEEAFPNQVPLALADDSPSSASAPEIEPHTIGTPHPIRVLFDSDDSQKDALGLSSPKFHPFKRNVALSDEFDSMTSKKGLKQLNDLVGLGEGASHHVKFPEGWVKKGLNFHGEDKKSSECKVATDINTLREAITNLEAEKEAGLLQYQKVLEKLSSMESDASSAQEAAKGLNERASKAEAEVEILNQNLTKLEMQREACLVEYQQCLERISSLETKIFHDQAEAENEAQNLKQALSILETEKDASLLQYNQCLEKISKMEMKISHYEEDVRILNERADRAETEVWSLKQTIVKLEEEREAAALRYQQCVETISKLETELSLAQEEARRLTIEQRALALELQNGVQMLKDVELRNSGLENEVRRVEDENRSLNEQNLSSDMSMKNLQDEIFSLKEMKEKLEEEVELQVEQRNALQKEIFCLKEEINDLRRQHIGFIKQVESVGLKPDCLVSSVKGLQDENSNLKERCQKENDEKAILVSTLEITTQNKEKLSEKIAVLENFLSAANVELESSREKSKSLEESCRSLGNEKSGLLTEIVSLVSQVKSSQQGLEEIEKRYTELEVKYGSLVEEKELKVRQIEELRASLDLEKQGHASSIKASETQLVHLEDEIHKAQFEIFILQKCIRDMEEKNFSLLIECQKRFETSKLSEKLISDLKQENLEQQTKIKSLLNQVEILRMGIHQMLKSLKTDPDYVCQDKMREDKILLQRVLGEIEGMESALLETQDEKQMLLFEKSVLVTLLGQEFNIRTEEVLMLQSEKCELLEITEQLRLEVRARDQRERVLNSELESQCAKLTDLQNVNSKLVQEKGYLMKKFSELKEENCMLEEENSVIVGEAMALGNLSLIFKIYGAEKAEELKGLSDVLDHLHGVNGVLEERLRSIEMENLHLKESVEGLVNELSEAEKKFKATESDSLELQRNVKGLKREYDEATVIREELEKKIVKFSEDNAHHNKDIGCLREENKRLELKLAKLLEEIEERKTKEGTFSSELQQKSNEVELWETEASTLYGDLEISNIRAVLFEEKVCELVRACESFEDERSLKIADIELLKEKLGVLEGENEGMKSELAAYFPIIAILRDNIMSLEDNVFSQAKIRVADNQETVGAVLASHLHDMNYKRVNEDQSAKKEIEELKSKTSLALYLQEVQTRVKAVEKAVMEMIRLGRQESLDTDTKLETAKKEIEELKKSKIGLVQGEGVKIQSRDDPNNLKLTKTKSEISNIRNEILMKDIPLDQVSNSSSYDHGFGLRAMGKKVNAETDEQMLELWETACDQIEEVVEQKSEHPSLELQGHQEGNKRKILETLASDDHKLTNLHVTVENLKKKVAQSEMSKKPKNGAYSIIKGQLEEVEMAIVQLVDINGKLTKNAEEGRLSTDGTWQGSEKIGRLQSEVQRIQFVLLKLDDEQQSKGTTVVTDRKILLRDYLYGVGRNSHGQRQKKVPFCMCVRPPTNAD